MMHFRMVNHLLAFFAHKVAKETAAIVLSVFVVLVLDDCRAKRESQYVDINYYSPQGLDLSLQKNSSAGGTLHPEFQS
jgi:hypothetical protein